MNASVPRGFSLLEVLIGIVILGIATTVMTLSSRTAQTGQMRSKTYGEAATATWEILEQVQNMSIDSMDRLKDRVMEHSQGPDITVKASIRGTLSSDVANINDLDTTSLRRLDILTTFKGANGQIRSMRFHTIVYRPK
ncbi:MAG TPA: type II secretion system protein [Fibrobacteria bacterium]|nr:type II secretion system protein [Fibrobacteria bacterium]